MHILTYLQQENVLDPERLSEVRAHWRRSGLPLLQSLTEVGQVDEQRAMQILVELTGLPITPLETDDVDNELIERVPIALLRRTGALPLGLDEGGRVRVATCAPFDVLGFDELQAYLRLPVNLVLAPWSAISAVLDGRLSMQDTIAETVVGEMLERGVSTGRIIQDDLADAAEEAQPAGSTPPRTREHGRDAPDGGHAALASASPVVRLADMILADALSQGASDIHLEPLSSEVRLRFRLQGVLRQIRSLPWAIGPALASRFKIMSRLDVTIRRQPQDGRLWFRSDADRRVIDVRVSTLPTVEGEKIVMRLLDPRSVDRPLASLIPVAELRRYLPIVERTQGLVLVTGPTGSGKTTTLYATLRHMLTPELNFVTIEQPVEYHIDGIAQVNVRPEDGTSFGKTLRSVLRQDPDVILVGEIRDTETARTALQAATTGHLVLSTLHTNDASSACTRLVDLGGEPFLLADALNGVLAQRLLRKLCPACRKQVPASDDAVAKAGVALRGATLFEATGCDACAHTGFNGRLAVHEIAPTTPAVRSLILQNSGDSPIREALRLAGVPSMFSAGLAGVLAGTTSLAELLRCVPQDEVEQILGCQGCGAVIRPGARFCVMCGRPSGDYCQGCGEVVDPLWRHCAACGHDTSLAPSPPAPAT